MGSDLVISGDVGVDLWSAIPSFAQYTKGVVTAYLRDCDGATHIEIGNGSTYLDNWQEGPARGSKGQSSSRRSIAL